VVSIPGVSTGFLTAFFRGLASVKIRRSALAPFLSYCLYVSLPCFVISMSSAPPLQYIILAFAAIPVLLFVIASLFLLFWDRDRLHTEEHLERKHALEIVEAKGQGLPLNPVDLVHVMNPYPEISKIPDASSDEEVRNA
jgi:hypothetical protein